VNRYAHQNRVELGRFAGHFESNPTNLPEPEDSSRGRFTPRHTDDPNGEQKKYSAASVFRRPVSLAFQPLEDRQEGAKVVHSTPKRGRFDLIRAAPRGHDPAGECEPTKQSPPVKVSIRRYNINMMIFPRLAPAVLVSFLALGCGSRYMPLPDGGVPPMSASAGQYSVRTDPLVIKLLDGAPKRWPSAGFPPLKSTRLINSTPDRDIADDLLKQFGKNILDPATGLDPSKAEQLARLLEGAFGTPAVPRVRVPTWDELVWAGAVRPNPAKGFFANFRAAVAAVKKWKPEPWRADWETANAVKAELKLDDAALARGSVLYRRWCMQCHGPTGAGDGAHAIELAAPPRDYRQGVFKFVTAFQPPPTQAKPGESPPVKKKGLGPSGKPRRDDLKRTVRNGLDGSMMPAFTTLSEQELDDLVSYVIHLSVRGETEFATMAKAMQPTEEDPEFDGPELEWLFDQNLLFVLYNWGVAAKNPIPIPPSHTHTDEDRLLSAIRGYKLYNSAEFGCAACHVNFGREPQLKWDLWGTIVQPRNLALGVYRGGRRGEDLYARIYGGIHPSGMTAFHTALKTGPSYPDRPDKIWNVVHFLQALSDPYERQRLQDPTTLVKFKARLKEQGDFFLEDLPNVKIDP
jgi:mono/diheme cytochrome c family protein